MSRVFIYDEIANRIAFQIRNGILKPGDKLPSIRKLCRQHGISMNTAKRVFIELEAQSLVESKPQSGFYVSKVCYPKLPLPEVSSPSITANEIEPDGMITKVYANMGRNDLTLFSIGVPSGSLLPLAKLKKEILYATSKLKGGGTEYEPVQGNETLRTCLPQKKLVIFVITFNN